MFKKILLATLLTVSPNQFCGAMEPNERSQEECMATMPGEEALRELFFEFDLHDFVEKTKIIKMLAGKNMSPLGIEIVKTISLSDYAKNLQGLSPSLKRRALVTTGKEFDAIIDKILQDFPEAKKQLQQWRSRIKKI
jgi:hypothetical protein